MSGSSVIVGFSSSTHMVNLQNEFTKPVLGQVIRVVCPNSPYSRRGVPKKLLSSIARWFGYPIAIRTIRLECVPNPECILEHLESIGLESNWPERSDILAFVLECDASTWRKLGGYSDDRGRVLDFVRSSLWYRNGNLISAC